MKKLLYILFCITLISCNSKTEEIKEEVIEIKKEIDLGISEEEIYAVINTHLEREIAFLSEINKELISNYLSFSEYFYDGVPNIINNDSLFTNEDRNFMKLQIQKNEETFDLNQKYFSDFKVIPKDSISSLSDNYIDAGELIYEKYGAINWVSLPLFSKNKDLAVIEYFYSCDSILCTHFEISIYKKENEKWIWVKNIGISEI